MGGKKFIRQVVRATSLFILLSQIIPIGESANIVFFFGVSSYSHRIPAWPLAEALAEKGHNVTFVSPHPAKKPNPKIHDYVPTKLKEWVDSWADLEDVFADRRNGEWYKNWVLLPDFGIMMCEEVYKDEEYLNWVKSSKVDLIFLDALSNDCAYGMAHYWGAKVILFQTTSPFTFHMTPYGLPDETAWIPNMEFYYPADMSFRQRMINGLLPVVWEFYRKWNFFPKLEEITKQSLEIQDLPRFEDIERNTSMIFLNTHYGEEFSRALPPNTISIGGIANTEKRKSLPKNLEAFLAKGDGFIYVSFGTYADFNRLDKPTQQSFIAIMKSFPKMQFVWKVGNDSFATEFPKDKVYINKWMPQQDILAHPKIRAFITHSGLLGIQEAVHNAVPLICFPIFADQDYNAERIHREEYGIRLEISRVTKEQLEDAIEKVVTDPKYRNNVKRKSMLFTERPQKPLDNALWWTEFVLRHSQEELSALRPLSVGQPWWVRRQLDVWATIVAVVSALSILLIYICFKLVKWVCCGNSSTKSLTEKNMRKKVQ